jgi:D-alanine-D-alanine ligase
MGSGPIADLEGNLRPDWWKTLFSATYLKTDGDVVESADVTSREVDVFVEALGLKPAHRILDLCCGQARHLLDLWGRGFRNLVGADSSRFLIRLARKRARLAGATAVLREADARSLPFEAGSFDCVSIMGHSFGYFADAKDDRAVLGEVRRVLSQGGRVYLDLADGDWLRSHFEARSWEWLDARHLACRERVLSRDSSRLISREVVVHTTRGVIADQIYAERLYSREQIVGSLISAGFDAIESHGALLGGSDRNQDLGMMAKRMLLSARAAVAHASSMQGA